MALDMAGCPNRCRHCYLGYLPTRRVDGAELREVVARLRAWVRPGEAAPYLRHVQAHTWFREPDYRPDYRALYDLERELSGREPARFELLSIWRLARDPDYAAWARRIGTEACQVTFFGLEVTHDWFVRRRGSFQDSLVATERLLEAGIRPRWQIFFTQHILPELDALYALVDRLRLRERCEALGGPFQVFLHTPCPDGEAIGIEGLRPTVSALARVPAELLTASVAHIGRPLGEAEADIVARLRRCAEPAATRWGSAERLGFYVTSRLDVYTNLADLHPWWRLGNLAREDVGTIIRRLEDGDTIGFRVLREVPLSTLAERYGRPRGRRLYTEGDLVSCWVLLESRRRWALNSEA
ncbi:MAG TPA: hypothetical protein GX714_04540 [Chloroflexi bacterium]|nr:hypothetical protein [Chloroflexota bacterium]